MIRGREDCFVRRKDLEYRKVIFEYYLGVGKLDL